MVALSLAIHAARRGRTARLRYNLRRQKVIAAGPDGRRVARPLVTHVWHWTAVSPDLLDVGVRAAGPTLEGPGPVRALEAEVALRGAALTPALQRAATRRRRHDLLMAHHAQLTAGASLPLLLGVIPDPDGLYDAVSSGFEAGHLPGADLLDGSALGPLGDAVPVLGVVGAAGRTARRLRAGQDLRTAAGVSTAEAALRGGGAAAMGKAGALAGSVFGPGGTVVGAAVGALLGGTVGHGLAQRSRWNQVRAWEARLEAEYTDLGTELVGDVAGRRRVMRELAAGHQDEQRTLQRVRRAARRRACHPRHWVRPDPQVVLLRDIVRCGEVATGQAARDVAALHRFVRDAAPARVAALLAHDAARCERLGGDPDRLVRVQELSRQIHTERALLR